MARSREEKRVIIVLIRYQDIQDNRIALDEQGFHCPSSRGKEPLATQSILHTLDFLDSKFEAVFKVVFGIDIVVSQPHGSDNDEKQDQEDFLGLEGSHSNPTLIDEVPLPPTKDQKGITKLFDSAGQPIKESSTLLYVQYGTVSPFVLYVMFQVAIKHIQAFI